MQQAEAMIGGMPASAMPAAAGGQTPVSLNLDEVPEVVKELCSQYNIDDKLILRLHNALKGKTEEELDTICSSLKGTLTEARNPGGLLTVKVKELENGTFVAGHKGPFGPGAGAGAKDTAIAEEIHKLCEKYSLEDR